MTNKTDDSFLHGNISIDLNKKNNEKKTSSKVTSKTSSKTKSGSRSIFSRSSNTKSSQSRGSKNRKSQNPNPVAMPSRRPLKMSSEHFLGHAQTPISYDPILDYKKLIKKGEKPVRIGSLLGSEQVGQCVFIEYENDMIIIDAGMEFAAKEELGADYMVPDISYIKKNRKKLRGIIITHGHLDHIGALRDMLPDLGYPVIYTTPLALGIIKKTFDDQKEAAKIKYKIVDPDIDLVKLGCFRIEFVRVNHNIPETMALAIQTPKGLIFDSADFKVDHTPAIDRPADLNKLARIGMEGVKLYIGDSLGSHKEGRSVSEQVIGKNLDELIRATKSRIIVATFASNIGRIIQFVNSAIKYNRVVFLSGRSMVNNVEICQKLGYINVPNGYVRKLSREVEDLPDERVLILSTGAQGEEFAGLTRMARGDHPMIDLRKGDTILMSSSTIPGNETSMSKMMNNLVVKDINLITNNDMDIHASGHGYAEDHKLFLSLLKPQFFRPFFMPAKERYTHKNIGKEMGLDDSRILMPNKNGHIIEMYDNVVILSKEQLKLDTVLVDGKGKGHLSGEYVIKARHIMAENGIISLIFKVDTKSKELVGNIQIESRGFVYSSEVKNIHTKIVEFARGRYNENKKRKLDVRDNLKQIKNELGPYVAKIIGREPMVVPMFVYINKDPRSVKDAIGEDEAIVGMTLEEQGG